MRFVSTDIASRLLGRSVSGSLLLLEQQVLHMHVLEVVHEVRHWCTLFDVGPEEDI